MKKLACIWILLVTISASLGDQFNGFSIEFVEVGNPGNEADDNGFGSVNYPYRIAKHEVSRAMIEAYNAANRNVLIDQEAPLPGLEKFFTPNHPTSGISSFSIVRFVNWLNTSRGFSRAYKEDRLSQTWVESDDGYDALNPLRNRNARYFLADEDEWYKAAYYDPNYGGQGIGGYWNYATGSNASPIPVTGGTDPNTAVWNQSNWNLNNPSISGGPAEITNAGGLSAYGTMAQHGNYSEITETIEDSRIIIRGGNFYVPWTGFYRASSREDSRLATTSFRIVASSLAPPKIEIARFYESQTNESVTVDATPVLGFPTDFTYQWFFEDRKIPAQVGGELSSFTIEGVEESEGSWKVVVSNSEGSTEAAFDYRVIVDSDGDGISDGRETLVTGTNPEHSDTDNDGISDGDEINVYYLNPLNSDSDNDTVLDGIELRFKAFGFDPSEDSREQLALFQQAASELPGVLTYDQVSNMNLGGIALKPHTNGLYQLNFIVEESDGLTGWVPVEEAQIKLTPSSTKKFVRVRASD